MLRHLQAYSLPRFRLWNVFMFNLHGLHHLFKICGWSLDKNAVTHGQRRGEFNDGNADLGEKMRYMPNFNYVFFAQTRQPLTLYNAARA